MTSNIFCRPVTGWRRTAIVVALAVSLSVWWTLDAARAFETAAREALLIDFETGTEIMAKNPDQRMPPASMSKLMTLYMVFEAISEGRLALTDTLPVSEKAWRMGGSKMFVEVGTSVMVDDLLRGIIIQSGNDACVVFAEALAGSEEAFAESMSRRALEIGLTSSHFANSTGWPDDNQYMTPRDLVHLTKLIIEKFPNFLPYFSELNFTYNDIRQGNRNPLLYKDIGVDGMKTGHTQDAGYGLTATAKRDDRRLILVINGLSSAQERANEGQRLIEYGFREFENYALFKRGETVDSIAVWLGDKAHVSLLVDQDVTVTLPRRERPNLKVSVVANAPLPTPIEAGDEIAKLVVSAPDIEPIEYPLVAAEQVRPLGLVRRLGAAISYLVFGPPPQ